MITLSKLRGFHTVAHHRSFRQAAQELGRTQPALTAQIADLEESLGVSLLERTTRQVRLTEAGKEFLVRTRNAIDEIDEACLEIKELVDLQRGHMSMGCIPTIAAHLVPQVLADYTSKYPGVHIQYFDEPTVTLSERLKVRELDFYIGPAPMNDSDTAFSQLYEDEFVVIFREGHRFGQRRTVTLKEILAEPQVAMAEGTNVRSILNACFDKLNLTYLPLLEARHHYTLGGIVQTGIGVTLLPSRALPLMSHADLGWCRIKDHKVRRSIGICTLRSRRLTPAATAFIEMIRLDKNIGNINGHKGKTRSTAARELQ